ncbi:1,5-anhydro-D-fructose reductase isoform X2 [Halyomorpha halys]|nr:1,5-anhydro-D-fructose reductase-like isoform X2 [Halyomorpha halys]
MKPSEVKSALCNAITMGYRHIDTAFVYGNEQEIGIALRHMLDNTMITRDQLFITSKLPPYAMNPDVVKQYVEQSLSNLGLKYFDLYLLHYPVGLKVSESGLCPDDHTNHLAIWRAMENEVIEGKIKSLGLSNFNSRQITNILECARVLPANLQIEMHLYCQQKELRQFCRQHCIAITAYAPLGSPSLDHYLESKKLTSNGVPRPLDNPSVQKIAEWHKKCPSQILLRYLIQLGGISIIPKSSNPDHICQNIDLFDFCLEPCEMKELSNMDLCNTGRMYSCNIWVGTNNHHEYPF